MPKPIPASLLTLYADLAQQVRYAERGGSIYSRGIGGATYLYAKIPAGASRREVYLGKEGDPEAEAKADSIRRAAEAARERRATVRTLQQRGLRGPNPWLGRMLDALEEAGLFGQGLVVVGTGAFQMMEAVVGHYLPEASLITADIDLVTANLAMRAADGETMETVLRRADPTINSVPELDLRDLPSRFKGKESFVDLLTPVLRRTDATPMPLEHLEAGAAPLQYLRWLIHELVSVTALWGAGVPVFVPAPARYAVHKLILPHKRNPGSREKRFKDLTQARALIEALSISDPFALEDTLHDARAQ